MSSLPDWPLNKPLCRSINPSNLLSELPMQNLPFSSAVSMLTTSSALCNYWDAPFSSLHLSTFTSFWPTCSTHLKLLEIVSIWDIVADSMGGITTSLYKARWLLLSSEQTHSPGNICKVFNMPCRAAISGTTAAAIAEIGRLTIVSRCCWCKTVAGALQYFFRSWFFLVSNLSFLTPMVAIANGTIIREVLNMEYHCFLYPVELRISYQMLTQKFSNLLC